MIRLDEALAQNYLAECNERVTAVEATLLAIEAGGPAADSDLVEGAFRSLHWIQGGASLFELATIGELARRMEDVLGLIRSHKLLAIKARTDLLLRATDTLRGLVQKPESSNQADISDILGALTIHDLNQQGLPTQWNHAPQGVKHLRILLAEDDADSRALLQTFLCNYGECDVAVNGREAVESFRNALEHGDRYDMICMDILMPEMDGREAVRQIRAFEEKNGIRSTAGTKIVMTTAVDDVNEMIRCFHELCDSYLTKPVDPAKLLAQMQAYHMAV
jgi:two-component system, chemotaxis family, chemotaxis protein CheY